VSAGAASTTSSLISLAEERHASPIFFLTQVATRRALFAELKTQTQSFVFGVVGVQTFPVVRISVLVEVASVARRV